MSLVVGLTLITSRYFLFLISYTWTNGGLVMLRVDRKLDKIFVNFDCLDLYKTYNYFVPRRSNFDHDPLLLSMSNCVVINRPSSFIFF